MIAWPFRGEKEDPFLLLLLLPKENTVGSPSPQHTKEERKGKRLVLLLLLSLLCPGVGPMGFGRNSVSRGSHSTRPQRFCILHIGFENIRRAQKHVVFNLSIVWDNILLSFRFLPSFFSDLLPAKREKGKGKPFLGRDEGKTVPSHTRRPTSHR